MISDNALTRRRKHESRYLDSRAIHAMHHYVPATAWGLSFNLGGAAWGDPRYFQQSFIVISWNDWPSHDRDQVLLKTIPCCSLSV